MIRYSVVGGDHKLCQEECPADIHHFMQKFWKSRDLGECDGAIVATKGREIIGFFRFYKQMGTMYGGGTYVLSPYRQLGVAKKLWFHAIKEVKPKTIDVTATSAGAIRLLYSLRGKYSNITWNIWKDGKPIK